MVTVSCTTPVGNALVLAGSSTKFRERTAAVIQVDIRKNIKKKYIKKESPPLWKSSRLICGITLRTPNGNPPWGEKPKIKRRGSGASEIHGMMIREFSICQIQSIVSRKYLFSFRQGIKLLVRIQFSPLSAFCSQVTNLPSQLFINTPNNNIKGIPMCYSLNLFTRFTIHGSKNFLWFRFYIKILLTIKFSY